MPVPPRRLALAVVVSAAVVLSAPFVGVVRREIREAFPAAFGGLVNGAVGLALGGAIVVGLRRIRERRAVRYAAIALAFLTGGAYAAATGSGDPNVRAVEHVHFVEFGLITWLFYRSWRERRDWSSVMLPVLAAFIVGIAEEAFQWFIPARVGELKDIWLNLVAVACGMAFAAGLEPPTPFLFAWRTGTARTTRRLAAVVVVALAAFVHVVHLGQEIRDPEIGAFGSRYSADQLAALSANRAAAWKNDPPLARPVPLSREDQYMTEGLQHVAARNAAWDRGDANAAWRENLILEQYFAPVLDTPSYVSATGHRWHPNHRADAEAQASRAGGGLFVSAAYPYPLFYWPPAALWAAALIAAGVAVGRR